MYPRRWDIDKSIFASRKTASDGHSYNDTPLVWSRRFHTDWLRVAKTQRFKKLVSMELKNEEMGEIVVAEPLRDLCEAEYPSIMAAFHYYCGRTVVCDRARSGWLGSPIHQSPIWRTMSGLSVRVVVSVTTR